MTIDILPEASSRDCTIVAMTVDAGGCTLTLDVGPDTAIFWTIRQPALGWMVVGRKVRLILAAARITPALAAVDPVVGVSTS